MNKERVKELEDFAANFNNRPQKPIDTLTNNAHLHIIEQGNEELEKHQQSLSHNNYTTTSSKKRKQIFVYLPQ